MDAPLFALLPPHHALETHLRWPLRATATERAFLNYPDTSFCYAT
jgi:hypothetical protein